MRGNCCGGRASGNRGRSRIVLHKLFKKCKIMELADTCVSDKTEKRGYNVVTEAEREEQEEF